ncbi:hypothetical protein PHLGIDRAFT_295041 [Phlebiopsis gigantea 11061_1 CR5-6]|uniref:Protein kinase domain-containing protein n=1 Tax=Phlebiopsis gigantea (strain 11061_1 CR5-6) TaxID=745531 RepID=A0A0C3S334_PHLG1|nr:hypothetical protein PHLGIDRAFT_295041 [Phlebiopsis gigantea 11061_1 CR5-6]
MSPFSLRQMLSNLRLRYTFQGAGLVTDHDANLLDATKGLSDSRDAPPTVTADIHRHTFVEDYRRPPPLPQVTLGKDIEFVGQSNPHGATPMFIIRAGENVLLLKVYADRQPVSHDDDFHAPDSLLDPRELFAHETDAYAHLVHYGACDKGVVPKCYGWVELAPYHLQAIFALPDISENAWDLQVGDKPPRGIVLEYFPDVDVMSIENVSHTLAGEALRGLDAIHSTYLQHCAVTRRHMLVLPDGRVVWVDFSASKNASDTSFTTGDLTKELEEAWYYMYWRMMPNKRHKLTRPRRIAFEQPML